MDYIASHYIGRAFEKGVPAMGKGGVIGNCAYYVHGIPSFVISTRSGRIVTPRLHRAISLELSTLVGGIMDIRNTVRRDMGVLTVSIVCYGDAIPRLQGYTPSFQIPRNTQYIIYSDGEVHMLDITNIGFVRDALIGTNFHSVISMVDIDTRRKIAYGVYMFFLPFTTLERLDYTRARPLRIPWSKAELGAIFVMAFITYLTSSINIPHTAMPMDIIPFFLMILVVLNPWLKHIYSDALSAIRAKSKRLPSISRVEERHPEHKGSSGHANEEPGAVEGHGEEHDVISDKRGAGGEDEDGSGGRPDEDNGSNEED